MNEELVQIYIEGLTKGYFDTVKYFLNDKAPQKWINDVLCPVEDPVEIEYEETTENIWKRRKCPEFIEAKKRVCEIRGTKLWKSIK